MIKSEVLTTRTEVSRLHLRQILPRQMQMSKILVDKFLCLPLSLVVLVRMQKHYCLFNNGY